MLNDLTGKRVVATLSILVILGVASAALHATRIDYEKRASSFFSAALKEQRVSASVIVDGASYSVEDGEVLSAARIVTDKERFDALRIAYARTIAERSPLLAVPGTDPDKLDEAVTLLSRAAAELATVQDDPISGDTVRRYLYPIDFLRSLAKLERSREAFIKTGADADEALYRLAARDAVDAYEKDLLLHKVAFTRIVPRNAVAYQVFEGVMTRESLIRSMDALLRGIRETAAKLEKRNACISGAIGACDSSHLVLPKPTAAPAQAAEEDTAYAFLGEIRSSYSRATGGDRSYLEKPVIELTNSVCMGNFDTPLLFALHKRERGAGDAVSPGFIGDILFVPAAPYKDMPFYRYFDENKIAYVYFPLWEHYKCPEIALDTAHIFGTKAVSDAAQTERFSRYAEGSDATTLRKIETRLIYPPSNIVRERDARAYVDGALRVLSTKQNVPPRVMETLFALSLADTYGTASFDQYIQRIARDELANIGLMRTNVPVELEAKYLFYVRSGFFSLFQGTNPSVTGVQRPPIDGNARSALESPFIRYTELRATVSQSELVHDMAFFFRIHMEAIKAADVAQ